MKVNTPHLFVCALKGRVNVQNVKLHLVKNLVELVDSFGAIQGVDTPKKDF